MHPSALVRRIVGAKGTVDLEFEYVPRPEYGLIWPVMEQVDGGVRAHAGAVGLAMSCPTPVDIEGSKVVARLTVSEGQELTFSLLARSSSEEPPGLWSPQEISDRLDSTVDAWRSWSALHQSYDGPWQDLVQLSGRVLYGLTYFPTGAMVAAPTTSLPETPGGTRNWDYRYSWVRDASFTLQALWVAACPDEAWKFFDFMAVAAASSSIGALISRSCSAWVGNGI